MRPYRIDDLDQGQEFTHRRGTFNVKRNKRARRVVVSADGKGVVSHAGIGLLREMAEDTGLVNAVTDALADTYKGIPVHPPSYGTGNTPASRTGSGRPR